MSETTEVLPVSMGVLIKEIKQISERNSDEYRLFEIHAFLPEMKESTLRRRLEYLQKQGKVSSRKINGVTLWSYLEKMEMP